MVSHLPLGVNDWPLADLDDAIARLESGVSGRLDEIDVSPLVAVMMDVVGDFAE